VEDLSEDCEMGEGVYDDFGVPEWSLRRGKHVQERAVVSDAGADESE